MLNFSFGSCSFKSSRRQFRGPFPSASHKSQIKFGLHNSQKEFGWIEKLISIETGAFGTT